MSSISKWDLVEARLALRRPEKELLDLLAYWHRHGVSAEAMARLLETETGVKVSGEAVRGWIRDRRLGRSA